MFLSPILWTSAVTTIRAALISLYISIFPTRSFSITCYTILVINVAFGASAIIADCLICQPISYRWGSTTVGGSCGDQKALDLDIAVLNLLLDVVVVVLPMPVLWGLPLARGKKTTLTCMFGIGIMYGIPIDQLPINSSKEMLTHVSPQGLWHNHLPRPGDLLDSRPHKSAHARHILRHRIVDLFRSPSRNNLCLLTLLQTLTLQASGVSAPTREGSDRIIRVGQCSHRKSSTSITLYQAVFQRIQVNVRLNLV